MCVKSVRQLSHSFRTERDTVISLEREHECATSLDVEHSSRNHEQVGLSLSNTSGGHVGSVPQEKRKYCDR